MKRSNKSTSRHRPPDAGRLNWQFDAIGTAWSIDVFQPVTDDEAAALQFAVQERIEAFDAAYSRFRSDSMVSEMAVRPGNYQLPEDAQPLFDLYLKLYQLTGGSVTPLIGNTLSDA